MSLSDKLQVLFIHLMSAYGITSIIVNLSKFVPGQWQHDAIWWICMTILSAITYGTSKEVFGSHTTITIIGIDNEKIMEETSRHS